LGKLVITDEKHPTYSIGKYSPEKPAEKRVIADFFRRNASFEHSSNKQQFLLFESHISPAFSKTNPEYFKRKTGSQYPCRRNRIGGTPIFTFPLPVRQK